MKYIGTLITMILLAFPCFLLAQGDGDVSELFDDGGISNGKNLFKVNLLSLVNADMSYSYERVLNESFSAELSAGLLLPVYGFEPYESGHFRVEDDTIGNPDFGYTLRIQPRFYYQRSAPEQRYFAVQLRRKKRNFKYYDKSIIYTDVALLFGIQMNTFGPMIFDYSVGIGIRYKKNEFDSSDSGMMGFSMPIDFKLGLIL